MVKYRKPKIKERKVKANLFFTDIWQFGSSQNSFKESLYPGNLLAQGDCDCFSGPGECSSGGGSSGVS